MLKIWDATNFRRTFMGLCLIAAPLVGLIGALVLPKFGDNIPAELTWVSQHPGHWLLGTYLTLVSFVLLVPATLGLLHLLRERAVVLGHLGGGLFLLGNFFHLVIVGFALTEIPLAVSGMPQSQLLTMMDQMFGHPAFLLLLPPFFGFHLGLLMLAVAVWRAKMTPLWMALLILAAPLMIFIAPDSYNNELLTGCLLISFGWIGLKVLRMSDTEWMARESDMRRAKEMIGPAARAR